MYKVFAVSGIQGRELKRRRKLMKKALCLVLILAMCVAFIGCGNVAEEKADQPDGQSEDVGNTDDAGTDDAEAPSEPVTLVVWGEEAHQALYGDAIKEINEAFMAANPNITIDFQWAGSFDALTVAVQTDTLPDVFYTHGNKLTIMKEMSENGYLLELRDEDIDISRFPQDAIGYATVDGKIYCSLPGFFDYATIYYNADTFEKCSVEVPNTWDEFVAVCETLKEAGELPMVYGGNGWLDRYWIIGAMAPSYYEDDMIELKETGTISDFSRILECFEDYRALIDAGYFGENFVASDMAGAQLSFTNGNGAMIVDGTWNKGLYEGMNIGCFPIPGKDGKKYAQSGLSQNLTYCASSKADPDAARKYLAFLSSLEAEQIMYNHVPAIPVIKGLEITDDIIAQAASYDVIGQNLYGVLAFAATDNRQPADLFTNDILPKLMTGDYSPEEAVEMLKAELAK